MPGNALRGTTFFIIGGNRMLAAMMENQGSKPSGLAKADFLIFMGGTDIDSQLYGERRSTYAQLPNFERDKAECNLFLACKGAFKIGICRGAQLLHVLNGGKLWQHVENHGNSHEVLYTNEFGLARAYNVSSTHHQMMRLPAKDGEIWATANQTRSRQLVTGTVFPVGDNHWCDPEIIYYKKTSSLCFQAHPEYLTPKETRELFFRCVTRMIG